MAAAEGDTAYYASNALYQLQLAAVAPRGRRITGDQAIALIGLLQHAAARPILVMFPNGLDRRLARDGLIAAAKMIRYWSCADEERAAFSSDMRADMIDSVRCLRNLLHNRALQEQIRNRATQRTERAMEELRSFLDDGAPDRKNSRRPSDG